jgi:hypothetical protein
METVKSNPHYYSTAFSGGARVRYATSVIFTLILILKLNFSGVFDTPMEKCPPVGSMGHVTGVPSSTFPNSSASKLSNQAASPYPSPPNTATPPIQVNKPRQNSNNQLATPPLTPENCVAIPHPQNTSTLAATLFPEHIATVAKSSIPLQISSWDGFILSLPNKPKVLYIDGQCVQLPSLRERWVSNITLGFVSHYLLVSLHSLIWPVNSSSVKPSLLHFQKRHKTWMNLFTRSCMSVAK